MERFSQRESILLGYNNQRPSTNPSTPLRNSDVDFNDVFGGPPRRSSVQEIRYGTGESPDFSASRMEEDGTCCDWPRVCEKPVFGEDNLNRRRYANDNFYDDIFGGDESPCRTPLKHERHPFSSTPGSRILSPAPPLPPAPDSFAPPSLPSTLSLPAKLTKGTDVPTFGSPTRSLRMSNKDPASNGSSSSDSPATHLSRFSSHATQGKELKNGSGTLLPSRSSQAISDLSISDKADKGGDSASQFHFSIYKWASKGVVPLLTPLRTERNSRTKENVKLERCSSAKDWMARESTPQNDGSLANPSSSSSKSRRPDWSTAFVNSRNRSDSLEERANAKPNLTSLSTPQNFIKDVPGSALSSDSKAESSMNSVSEKEVSGKMKEELVQTIKTDKAESKSSHSLFSKSDDPQEYTEKIKMEKGKESKTMKSSAVCDISTNWKKQVEKTVDLKGVEATKAALQSSLRLDENVEKVKAKGKVKEFVRIFSHEAYTKPRVGTKSSEYKLRSGLRTEEAEGNPRQSKKEDSATETTNISGNGLPRQDDIPAPAIPDSTVAVEDGLFHGNFLVKELAQDENEVIQTQDNQEIKVVDGKIRQWSNGKQGNIRSLLSTLQYVLWPDSGWKPVPLVDIIEGNAVKRAYQRALLCLHPDKLQQKGAASHQKYIAEKVFDILQEAWTQFNMVGAL